MIVLNRIYTKTIIIPPEQHCIRGNSILLNTFFIIIQIKIRIPLVFDRCGHMARMYSRRRGKSGSDKPAKKEMKWVSYKPEEIEEIIVKLAKKGTGSAEIGLILRDVYGIPSVRDYSRNRIARIMKKHNAYAPLPEDMFNLMKRAVRLENHLAKNKRDYTSKRGLALTESKIRRLAKYYKHEKLLPHDWKYNPVKARLMIKS